GPRDRERHAGRAEGTARQHCDRARPLRPTVGRPRTRSARADARRLAGAGRNHGPPHQCRRRAATRRRAADTRRRRDRPRHADRPRAKPRRRLSRDHRPPRGRSRMTTRELAATASAERRSLLVPTAISDALAIAWRGLITYRRVPQLLGFSTIQPVVFG